MKIFEEMWTGVGDKVTDLVFRMEQVDPDYLAYLGARWQLDRARTIHDAPAAETAGRDGPRLRRPRPAGGGDRRQPAGRPEARAAPQDGQKGGPQRPLPLRLG
jgi:preprotein translocase subunit SecA